MPLSIQQVQDRAQKWGLGLVGAVPAAQFDDCQPAGRRARELLPDCHWILLFGSGGDEFWQRMHRGSTNSKSTSRSTGVRGSARAGYHPINRFSAQAATDLEAMFGQHPRRVLQPDDRRSLNFSQLAEMAGMGTISPVLGLLLHPQYGSWVSLRLAILLPAEALQGASEPDGLDGFQPCLTCSQPCVQACPVEVFDGAGGANMLACASHRHRGGCRDGCEARRACPVGAEQRYGPQEESFRHAYSLFAMRRHYGLGLWRLWPRSWRG